MKKTFKIEIKADKCEEIFADGLNKGILGYIELTYNLPEKDFESPMFEASLIEKAEEFRDECVKIQMREIK